VFDFRWTLIFCADNFSVNQAMPLKYGGHKQKLQLPTGILCDNLANGFQSILSQTPWMLQETVTAKT